MHAGMFSFFVLCRQQSLHFRPSLEEVRAKYYREMKMFLCIPRHFRGVGDHTSVAQTIFPQMIDRNADSFMTVYQKVNTGTFTILVFVVFFFFFVCVCVCVCTSNFVIYSLSTVI